MIDPDTYRLNSGTMEMCLDKFATKSEMTPAEVLLDDALLHHFRVFARGRGIPPEEVDGFIKHTLALPGILMPTPEKHEHVILDFDDTHLPDLKPMNNGTTTPETTTLPITQTTDDLIPCKIVRSGGEPDVIILVGKHSTIDDLQQWAERVEAMLEEAQLTYRLR